jgi:hypothetical protein
VNPVRRGIMHRCVRMGGNGGYEKAAAWWDTENFASPMTGGPIPAPAAREMFFNWGRA